MKTVTGRLPFNNKEILKEIIWHYITKTNLIRKYFLIQIFYRFFYIFFLRSSILFNSILKICYKIVLATLLTSHCYKIFSITSLPSSNIACNSIRSNVRVTKNLFAYRALAIVTIAKTQSNHDIMFECHQLFSYECEGPNCFCSLVNHKLSCH